MLTLLTSTSALVPSLIPNADPTLQTLVPALALAAVIVWVGIATMRLLRYIDFFKQSAKVADAFKQATLARSPQAEFRRKGCWQNG